MTEATAKVTLLLALPGGEDYMPIFQAAQAYPDVQLAALCSSPEQLQEFLTNVKPEVCILDANMLDPRDRPGVTRVRGIGFDEFARIQQQVQDTLFLVLLDRDQGDLRAKIGGIPGVREVLPRPVNPTNVVQRAASLGLERRRQLREMAPLAAQVLEQPRTAATAPISLAQQKLIGVMSWNGGVGKTTLSVALWSLLWRYGVDTLLIGFARPDVLRDILGLREAADMLQFLRRPTLEGFQASMQKYGDWPVIPGPRKESEADQAVAQNPALIRDLIYRARERFSCVVMDLPHEKGLWSLEPLRRSNVILTVLQPRRVQVNHLVLGTYALLTFDPAAKDGGVVKENVFTVLNGSQEGDIVTPAYVGQAFAAGFGQEVFGHWCPPNLAVIPHDPTVPRLQDLYEPGKTNPVRLPELNDRGRGGDFMTGVQAIIQNVFAGTALATLPELAQAGRKRKVWPFG